MAKARRKESFHFATGKSPLGPILVATSEFGIVGVIAAKNKIELLAEMRRDMRNGIFTEGGKWAKEALKAVQTFIEEPMGRFPLPLDIRGTPFQRRVWDEVRKIPPGETSTYSEIAALVRAPRAVRAVASSCTNSKFFMLIPCHRILHKGDTMEKKLARSSPRRRRLIEWEIKRAEK